MTFVAKDLALVSVETIFEQTESHLNSEIIEFEDILSDNYSMLALLCADYSLYRHANYSLRISLMGKVMVDDRWLCALITAAPYGILEAQVTHGALHYFDSIQKSLPDIVGGKRTRAMLDVGYQKLLLEFNCVLRLGDYFVWSTTPLSQMFQGATAMKVSYNERAQNQPPLCDECCMLIWSYSYKTIVCVPQVTQLQLVSEMIELGEFPNALCILSTTQIITGEADEIHGPAGLFSDAEVILEFTIELVAYAFSQLSTAALVCSDKETLKRTELTLDGDHGVLDDSCGYTTMNIRLESLSKPVLVHSNCELHIAANHTLEDYVQRIIVNHFSQLFLDEQNFTEVTILISIERYCVDS